MTVTKAEDKFYIIYVHEGDNVYERTSGCEKRAIQRVDELKKVKDDAMYFKNEIPKDFEYFY